MKNEEISLKSTKAEIFEALTQALEREEKRTSMKYEPEKVEEKKKVEKAIEVAKENVEKNIFADELNKKFNDLEIAIRAEEEKLKELYDIENELSNIVVVVNAGKEYIAKIEEEKNVKTEELNSSIKELEESYRIKKENLEKEYEVESNRLKIQREREIEEYEYNLKRERLVSNNKWEDEKAERENELARKEIEITALLDDAKLNSDNVDELERKVASIPEELKNEYSRGMQDMKKQLEKEYEYSTEILKKDFQNVIDRQN